MKALITGASSGIGRDMAYVLAKKGWDLILVARREDRLNQIKQQLSMVDVRCITADLSVPENCYKLYEDVKDDDVDMLINNAGFGAYGEFCKIPLQTEINMINTNVTAVHILTKLFLQDFTEKNSGYILNTASSAGFMAGPLMATYYASKNYVLRLTEAIYEELRRKKSKVKISVLCPGPVQTEFNSVANVNFSISGLKSRKVAKYAIDSTLKGKLVIIPGAMMKTGRFLERFLAEKTMLKISYKIQNNKN